MRCPFKWYLEGPRFLSQIHTHFLGRFLPLSRTWNLLKCFSSNIFTLPIIQLKCLLQKCSFLVFIIAIIGTSGYFRRKSESIKEVRNWLNSKRAKLNTWTWFYTEKAEKPGRVMPELWHRLDIFYYWNTDTPEGPIILFSDSFVIPDSP